MPDPWDPTYYDAEATAYDDKRGGRDRARRAADAVLTLAPVGGTCVDVAGGTGIVSAELAARGIDVLVVDRSVGMLGVAAARLPGRVLCADGTRLPLADAAVDLVTTIWLLHLVGSETADAIAAEAARVLRPGGRWVTSVDKDLSHRPTRRTDADEADRVAALAGGLGLSPAGTATFTGATVWDTAGGGDRQTFRLAAFERR
ncbi:MAG: hypothetical protein JWO46_2029 [Nocardioidaceae bacterium]|nr:hypothetical protein [Nocardioidaceae bacterium]